MSASATRQLLRTTGEGERSSSCAQARRQRASRSRPVRPQPPQPSRCAWLKACGRLVRPLLIPVLAFRVQSGAERKPTESPAQRAGRRPWPGSRPPGTACPSTPTPCRTEPWSPPRRPPPPPARPPRPRPPPGQASPRRRPRHHLAVAPPPALERAAEAGGRRRPGCRGLGRPWGRAGWRRWHRMAAAR